MPPVLSYSLPLLLAGSLAAQSSADLLNQLKGQSTGGTQTTAGALGLGLDGLPKATTLTKETPKDPTQLKQEEEESSRIEREIRAIKAKEHGPLRFAADLFQFRQRSSQASDGGIGEDYVLGPGDQLTLSAFGSATFDAPIQVDGRGTVVVPKVGAIRVGGMSLGKAKARIQGLVGRNFSNTEVELSVIKLREVRVFVLGEVYKPGSYLVSSLSSLINVLSLAGGPTAAGSYRNIRVMRGGKLVHLMDLYPLRAEGLGNLNVSLQSGDTLFVPLAFNQVTLEGAFARVVATSDDSEPKKEDRSTRRKDANAKIKDEEENLKKINEQINTEDPSRVVALDPTTQATLQTQREKSLKRLESLRQELESLAPTARGDLRIEEKDLLPEAAEIRSMEREQRGQPDWLRRWQGEGRAPSMQFEMLPGETVADALRYAGGFAQQAFSEGLSLKRLDSSGAINAITITTATIKTQSLERGDVLSALPRREHAARSVEIKGWARVPGHFARTEGLRVGELLKQFQEVLPDTYMGRGEITRTSPDGRSSLQAFDLTKAFQGDPAHNLVLEDRDQIELYRTEDLRPTKTVTVKGPFSRPGTFPWREGMRAADLLFWAGTPLQQANRMVAELAHSRDGKPSQILQLNLEKLLPNEQSSPAALLDDTLNPRIEPFDQLSLYAKPDFRTHRTITLSGQVNRPGTYAFDTEHPRLSDLIARAGGLTPEAMPRAGVFLRNLSTQDPDKAKVAEAGLETQDPTANGINSVLERLAETKRQPTTGTLLANPILHKLQVGRLTRMVVDLPGALSGKDEANVELQDGDEIIIPRQTDVAYVVGETASPFAVYKVQGQVKVKELIRQAGGPTRNADTWNIRLLKADGRIMDHWVEGKQVEPGDTVLVPQRIKRDTTWAENLAALTPLAILINTFK